MTTAIIDKDEVAAALSALTQQQQDQEALKPRSISPQKGPQEQFLSSPADIVIYGGAAGGGKSYALLLEPLRHMRNPGFGGIIFRRTGPQLKGPGSLWENATEIYSKVGARLVATPSLKATFKSGATLEFSHLQYSRTVHEHQGKQYAFVGFDELTHFEEYQFFYLLSRMRSVSGVRPYMRATTNPDPDSFVRKFIDWWIDDEGYPIPARSGQIRWYLRRNGKNVWADSKEELIEVYGRDSYPLSVTFIPASLDDNPELLKVNPEYRAMLDAQDNVSRARLLLGNWDTRHKGGEYIREEHLQRRWKKLPPVNIFMASDFAVAPAIGNNNPDYTEHGVFGIGHDDKLYVIDWWYGQTSADEWIDSLLDLWEKHRPSIWFGEGGVIRHAIEPFLEKRMQERSLYTAIEWVNPAATRQSEGSSKQGFADRSKRAKAIKGRAFQARASAGTIVLPEDRYAEWVPRLANQLVNFPAGPDDSFDVLATMCRGLIETTPARLPERPARVKDSWERKFDEAWEHGGEDHWMGV